MPYSLLASIMLTPIGAFFIVCLDLLGVPVAHLALAAL